MSFVDSLARALAEFEGFFSPGSRAARNQNPGNLKYAGQAGAVGSDAGGFAVFSSAAAGWAALRRQIEVDTARGDTLESFLAEYAPASENPTREYVSFVSGRLGIPADVPLSLVAGGSGQPLTAGLNLHGDIWLYAAAGVALLCLALLLVE